jgi:hypothetical protein
VRAGAERLPRVDHQLVHARAHGGLLPGRAHVQLAADQQRRVEALPAVGPVVGDLLAAHDDAGAADIGYALVQRGQLARRPVDRVLDPALAVDLLEPLRRQLDQRREHRLGVGCVRPDGEADQAVSRTRGGRG